MEKALEKRIKPPWFGGVTVVANSHATDNKRRAISVLDYFLWVSCV
jgi:hypothetical protein